MIQYSYTFDPETRTLTPSGDPVNVKGDTNVVQIVFTMPASYEGLALSSYVWRVFYKIAMNTKLDEVRFHQFTDQTTEGENLVLTWTVTNSVTEFAGHLGFALSGTLTDTGGNVTNRINSIPAYERIEPTIGGGSYTEDDAEIEGIKDFLVGIQEAAEAAQAAAETAAAEAEASAARAEQIADELEPYKSLAIVESASGDPATFTDGSNGVPMKSVSVGIDPVQDLNGYEYPWVGGANKNLLDVFGRTISNSDTVTTIRAESCSASFSGSSIVATSLQEWAKLRFRLDTSLLVSGQSYTLSAHFTNPSGRNVGVGWLVPDSGVSWTVGTLSTNTDFESRVSFTYNGDTIILLGVMVNNSASASTGTVTVDKIQFEKGSSATSYVPYSNICPISGWDAVNVTRAGKNILYNPITQTISSNGVTFTQRDDNKVVINGTASSNAYYNMYTWDNIDDTLYGALKGKSIKLVNLCGVSGIRLSFATRDANNAEQMTIAENNTAITTIPEEATTLYIAVRIAQGTTLTNFVLEPMIVFSEVEDTNYEPYNGQTFPISLTSAGTVYGGTLDVATGELVVDRKMVNVGSLNWYKRSSGTYQRFYTEVVADIVTPSSQSVHIDIISDSYRTADNFSALLQTNGAIAVNTTGAINITDSNYSTANDFKTARKDVQIVYPLATPLTYTLTPTQITSLLGVNHIWADCGEVAVEYVADTKMYIDKIVASL